MDRESVKNGQSRPELSDLEVRVSQSLADGRVVFDPVVRGLEHLCGPGGIATCKQRFAELEAQILEPRDSTDKTFPSRMAGNLLILEKFQGGPHGGHIFIDAAYFCERPGERHRSGG